MKVIWLRCVKNNQTHIRIVSKRKEGKFRDFPNLKIVPKFSQVNFHIHVTVSDQIEEDGCFLKKCVCIF